MGDSFDFTEILRDGSKAWPLCKERWVEGDKSVTVIPNTFGTAPVRHSTEFYDDELIFILRFVVALLFWCYHEEIQGLDSEPTTQGHKAITSAMFQA